MSELEVVLVEAVLDCKETFRHKQLIIRSANDGIVVGGFAVNKSIVNCKYSLSSCLFLPSTLPPSLSLSLTHTHKVSPQQSQH